MYHFVPLPMRLYLLFHTALKSVIAVKGRQRLKKCFLKMTTETNRKLVRVISLRKPLPKWQTKCVLLG